MKRRKASPGKSVLKLSVVPLIMALAACGGGGGGDSTPETDRGNSGDIGDNPGSGGNPEDNASITPITGTNYAAIAKFGLGATGFVEMGSSGSGIDRNPAENSDSGMLLRSASTTTPADCDSGVGSETSRFAVAGQISEGDLFSGTYDYCETGMGGIGSMVRDGSFSLAYSNVTGNYFLGDTGAFTVRGEYSQYSFGMNSPSDPGFLMTMDGDVVYEMEKTATTHRMKFTSDNISYTINDEEGTSQIIMANASSEALLRFADNLENVKGAYDATIKAEGFYCATNIVFDVQGSAESDYFSSGTITIKDNNGPAIIVMKILSEEMVQVEFDKDGDGTSEEIKTITQQ